VDDIVITMIAKQIDDRVVGQRSAYSDFCRDSLPLLC
jgi:hypothetical protein